MVTLYLIVMHFIGNFIKNVGNFNRMLVTFLVLKILKLLGSSNKFVLGNKLRQPFCTKTWSSKPKYKIELMV